MKIKIALVVSLIFISLYCRQNALTYTRSGGRFGDDLVAYTHVKWLSHLYGIPLLYKPFPFSDMLKLHYSETLYDEKKISGMYKKVNFNSRMRLIRDSPQGLLYIIPYFPESLQEYENINSFFLYSKVNWSDQKFMQELRSLISPVHELKLIPLPQDKITVAVHVRKGTQNIDTYQWINKLPFKFPNDTFYIESIKKIYEIFEQPLYVYIFTDCPSPQKIKNTFEHAINNPHIQFACRNSSSDADLLVDFFSMMHFDCLIRPDSNYSIMASRLGTFKIIISPASLKKSGNGNVIDKIHIEQNLTV